MRRDNSRRIGIIWFISILVFVSLMITGSYYLTAYLYKIGRMLPPAWLVQVVNSLLGLIFTALAVNSATRFGRSKGWTPEMRPFGPILEAMEKIARGDFSVRLESEFPDNRMVGDLAKSVNKMALELDQMENMRQEFISNVSHEIQSPLTSIRGFAQALENDQLGAAERHHYLGIIENESTRLSRITEDLLKLASLESDRVRFEPKLYRLDQQIRSLVLVSEPQWMDKNIEMEVSLKDVEISADEDLLSQVWTNLINNSIKFTPPNGNVRINLFQKDGCIEFSIADTGIGISQEDQLTSLIGFIKPIDLEPASKKAAVWDSQLLRKLLTFITGLLRWKVIQSLVLFLKSGCRSRINKTG